MAHNWIIDYLCNRHHCTKFNESLSKFAAITASVIQGSALGPFLFSITASSFVAIVDGNIIFKYADDFDMLIPSSNTNSIPTEIKNLEQWAEGNNLHLNIQKTQEMIIYNKYAKDLNIPPEIPGIKRVKKIKVLGVTIDDKLTFNSHIDCLVSEGHQRLYVLKNIKSHGLSSGKLYQVSRALLINKLTYCAPAWYGFCSTESKARLSKLVKKAVSWGIYSLTCPSLSTILDGLDITLLNAIKANPSHSLRYLLPEKKEVSYQLRKPAYQKTIISHLQDKNFISRMLKRF